MLIIDLSVSLFLTCWFIFTIIHHIPQKYLPSSLNSFQRSPLILRFIPTWNFFAPTPGMNSFHLLYRDQLNSGQMDGWHEIIYKLKQKPFRAFWNPLKTIDKAIIDVVVELSRTVP